MSVPAAYPLSTVSVEKGIGLRLNLLWAKPQDGEGRIPEYWEESNAGTGMALTTAETQRQQQGRQRGGRSGDKNKGFYVKRVKDEESGDKRNMRMEHSRIRRARG